MGGGGFQAKRAVEAKALMCERACVCGKTLKKFTEIKTWAGMRDVAQG